MECDPTFNIYVNILYSTTIHKINNYMEENLSREPILNDEFELRALFYGHELLQSTVNRFINTYLRCFEEYKGQ